LNNRAGKKGFTLIELVVVIAIISIMAVIVLPRLDPFVPSRRLKGAARTLSGTITLAYGESVAKNKRYRLYLDPMEETYWVVQVKETEKEDSGGAIGLTLGTQFELLHYEESGTEDEVAAPSEPLFAPQKLPQGVHFSSMSVGDDTALASSKPRYIEFTPLGVASPATVTLVNEDGDTLSVQYDGITGMPTLVASTDEI